MSHREAEPAEQALALPDGLRDLALKMARHPGVEVSVPASLLQKIDEPFREALASSLLERRERERAMPMDSLNLRVR